MTTDTQAMRQDQWGTLDEDLILRLLRESGMDRKGIEAVTYTSWKDGIDIERASTALVRFVRSVQMVTPTPVAAQPAVTADQRATILPGPLQLAIRKLTKWAPELPSTIATDVIAAIGLIEQYLQSLSALQRQTPQHTVHVTRDYGSTRVVRLGVNPEHQNDVIVQEKVGDLWVERGSYNSLSNDMAYSSAGDDAERINRKHAQIAEQRQD